MARFTPATLDGPLSDEEWQPFVAWARSRPTFRHCQQPTRIDGWDTTYHKDCCLALIQGTVLYKSRLLTLPELVSRWRELGRPEPPPADGRGHHYGPRPPRARHDR